MQWSRPSVQMVQVRLSAKLCFSFNHIYPLAYFPLFLLQAHYSLVRFFCDERISSNVNITHASAHPDLEIKGGGENGHSDLKIIFSRLFGPQFGLKIRGGLGPPALAWIRHCWLILTLFIHSLPSYEALGKFGSPPHTRSAETPRFPLEFVTLRVSLFRWNRVDPAIAVSYSYYGSCW